jgi:hypothetical protein
MPKIRRKGLPPGILRHLIERSEERGISQAQLGHLTRWLALDTTVPEGKWFKRFPEMIVCGEGEWIKTFLRSGQVPTGEEVF